MRCQRKHKQSYVNSYKQGCRCPACKAAAAADRKTFATKTAAYNKQYKNSRVGKLTTKKYETSEGGKASRKAYHASAKGKAVKLAYINSGAGKASAAMSASKRRSHYKHSMLELTDHERKLMYMIYSLRPLGYEVDHIHPLSKGGLDIPSNLQYLSISDNRQKHAKLNYIPKDRIVLWYELIDPLTGDAR